MVDGWCCFSLDDVCMSGKLSLLHFKSNCKLLLGHQPNEILTNRSPDRDSDDVIYGLFPWPLPFLSSCHGDVNVANDCVWPLASVVCVTSSPPMRELYQWTSEVLDGCISFYFTANVLKVSKRCIVLLWQLWVSCVYLFQVWNDADKSRFYYLAI